VPEQWCVRHNFEAAGSNLQRLREGMRTQIRGPERMCANLASRLAFSKQQRRFQDIRVATLQVPAGVEELTRVDTTAVIRRSERVRCLH
jgi:hypothetical protein